MTNANDTSQTLLEKLRDPTDSTAWDRFVSLYTPLLLSWARRLRLQGTDPADLVQDVFVKLLRELPQFRYDPKKGNFRSWLRTLCFHQWTDYRRKHGIRLRQLGNSELAALETTDDGLEEFWTREFNGFLVRQALRICDELCGEFEPQTIFAFKEVMMNHRPVNEVAQQLGIAPNAVSLAKVRVLQRLRRELKEFLN